MAPRPRTEFAELLRGLEPERFEAFLIALWEARSGDRAAEVLDGTLVIEHEGRTRRFQIDHPTGAVDRLLGAKPDVDGGTDGVVTVRRRPPYREAVDGRVIAADDLYDMAYYAVGTASRERLFREYFGLSAAVPRSEDPPADGPERVVVTGAVVVVASLLLGGVWVSGALPGAIPAAGPGTPAETPVGTPTAATTASPAGTATGDAPATAGGTAEVPLFAMSGEGERARTEFVPTNFTVDSRVTIIEFKHQGPGPYAVWVSNESGGRRWVVTGNGSADATVLLDLDRGEYDLHVLAETAWIVTVRLSEPPDVIKNPYSVEAIATVFGGPLSFDAPKSVTVYGLTPNATYRAALNDRQGRARRVLANTTGNRTPVRTNVSFRGAVYVEMTTTGEWRVVIRRAE